jgi:hypothetical protein
MLSTEALDELVRLVADELERRGTDRGEGMTARRWLSVAEAAEHARRPVSWIYDARSSGKLSRTGTGGCALVDRHELDRIIEAGGV